MGAEREVPEGRAEGSELTSRGLADLVILCADQLTGLDPVARTSSAYDPRVVVCD